MVECLKSPKAPTPQCSLELCKTALLFFLTRTIREKDRKAAFEFATWLRVKLHENIHFAKWTLDVFSEPQNIDELFKNCPSKDIRQLNAHMLIEACTLLYPSEASGANNRLF